MALLLPFRQHCRNGRMAWPHTLRQKCRKVAGNRDATPDGNLPWGACEEVSARAL